MIKLEDFPIRRQQTPYTCGYATIGMISSFLGKQIEEEEIPLGFLFKMMKGLLPSQFIRTFERCLPDYSIELRTAPKEIIVETIFQQLKDGIPGPIIYSTVNDFDKPNLVMHYAIVIGIDERKAKVVLANPFGYEEILELEDFLEKMAYRNYTEKPFAIRLALLLGTLKRNSLFVIKNRGSGSTSPDSG